MYNRSSMATFIKQDMFTTVIRWDSHVKRIGEVNVSGERGI